MVPRKVRGAAAGFSSPSLAGGFGGPSGKAVSAGPVTCAASMYRLSSGLKLASRLATSGSPCNLSTGILVESGEVVISGSSISLGPAERLDNPGRRHRQMGKVGGDHVAAVEVVGMEIEPGDIVERLVASRQADPLRIAPVARHDTGQHLEPPRFEQAFEIARNRRLRRDRAGLLAPPASRTSGRQRSGPCRP